jgi:glycerol-3-phosphate acyltransferase PlsX
MVKLKERMDPNAYGGALLLGVKAPFIICHGSSKAYAITNAIGVAVKFTENNLVSAITEKIAESQKRNEETDK